MSANLILTSVFACCFIFPYFGRINIFTVAGIIPDTNPTGCQINDTRKSQGICKKLTDCQSAVGNLQSGILPTPCTTSNGKPSSTDVCCQINERISAKKCEIYKRTLWNPVPSRKIRVSNSNDPRGPQTSKIQCEKFLSNYISGGRDSAIREYPHQVALGYGSGNVTWRCGGTLISEEYVLTAAHCVKHNSQYGLPVKVLLGDRKLSKQDDSNRLIVDVLETISHPEYKPPVLYNDIGLIKLKSKVKLSRSVLPACLPQPEDRLDKNINVEATGWGQLGAVESQSDILQSVNLNKFGIKDCATYFSGDPGLKIRLPLGMVRSQFCAGDKKGMRDTCRGDSGGPVVVNKVEPCVFYVIGITSFGSNFCGYQQPGVYTNVQRYLDWIEDIVWKDELEKINDNSKSLDTGLKQNPVPAKPQSDFMFPYIKSSTTISIPSTTTTEKQVLLLIGDSRKTGTTNKAFATTLKPRNVPPMSGITSASLLIGPTTSTDFENGTAIVTVGKPTAPKSTALPSITSLKKFLTVTTTTKPTVSEISTKRSVPFSNTPTTTKGNLAGTAQLQVDQNNFDSISSQIDSPLDLVNQTSTLLFDVFDNYDSTKISDVLTNISKIYKL